MGDKHRHVSGAEQARRDVLPHVQDMQKHVPPDLQVIS